MQIFLQKMQQRLNSIKEQNGYPLTIKKVTISPVLNATYDTSQLPLIEIVQVDEQYEHNHAQIHVETQVALRLVAHKNASDEYMEIFKSAVIRALFCGSYDYHTRQTQTAADYGDGFVQLRLLETQSDLGFIQANRVYIIVLQAIFNVAIWEI
ncbi:MAG: hypothetical protein QW255_04580 [Candidatus Bilamarchaeaceae archaeon]